MKAHIAVAKVGKYATSISGDTLEIIERPNGGISYVLADGQWSGKSAKAISNVVTRKALSLLADGVRDGAAARAASDYLYTYRTGKVQATLNILSIDLQSETIVITRNNPAPVILIRGGQLSTLNRPVEAVGTKHNIRPDIREYPLEVGLSVVIFTDGLIHAGERIGKPMNIVQFIQDLLDEGSVDVTDWADHLLNHAIELDEGRPSDDISVAVTTILPQDDDDARRLSLEMPIR
jgi:serine phosphatase RsbU (regulator of sigma subunit)